MLLAASPDQAQLLDVNGTLIAEIVAFLILFGVLAKWVFPPIMIASTAREKVIEKGRADEEEAERRLESVQQEVEQILDEAKDEARRIAGEAHRAALAEAQKVWDAARRQVAAMAEQARSDLAAEQKQASDAIRRQVDDLVVAAAGRILGGALNPDVERRIRDHAASVVDTLSPN